MEQKILTNEETKEYWEQRRFFETALPIPPFYCDGNSIKAVTWFKDNSKAAELVKRLDFYFRILRKYQVEWEMARSADPGEIIYEDEYQVGVVKKPDALN